MDICTHVLAGALAGGGVALIARGSRTRLVAAMSWGAFGGFLPDVDAAPRMPGFDVNVGQWLGLQPGADIYYGSHWYSHHHFTHSLVAGLGAAAAVCLFLALERLLRGPGREGERSWAIGMAPMAMLCGHLAHLAGDLVTPASVWGGIQLLWPLPDMVGGWGLAWWFNNYDLFLVQVVGLGLLMLVSLPGRERPILARLLPAGVLLATAAACVALLWLRETDYAYDGHAPDYQALESASLVEQRRLLPPPLYRAMNTFDTWNPLPF